MDLNHAALVTIREYLDEMMYALVDLRLSFEVGPSPTGFPKFQSLQALVQRLDRNHQVVFRLFRLGEPVEDTFVGSVIPRRVLAALTQAEILQKKDNHWQTRGLLIIPVEGLILLVSVPPSYPTATKACSTWFDLSSHVMARALPHSLSEQKVLDICSGSGIQSLLCAARGATDVVGLEVSEEAVVTARANAILNGLELRTEFRRSNMLEALKQGECFDFVVCNTPYAPVIDGDPRAVTLETLGNSVLIQSLNQLASRLSPRGRGILATWRAAGQHSSTYQMQHIASELESRGFSTFAYVDRAPDTPEGVLRILENDLEQRPGMGLEQVAEVVNHVKELLQGSGDKMDGFYNQLIYFRRGKIECVTTERMICGIGNSASAGAA